MGILETDRLKLAELCRSNGISRLSLFGSAARGEATSGSDIDLIADLPDAATLLDMVRLEREFSSTLGMSVDLLTEDSISPYIREHIKDDILVVYEAN